MRTAVALALFVVAGSVIAAEPGAPSVKAYALNVNNVTNTKYFVPHQDYLQVYPGEPANVLATVRVRLK